MARLWSAVTDAFRSRDNSDERAEQTQNTMASDLRKTSRDGKGDAGEAESSAGTSSDGTATTLSQDGCHSVPVCDFAPN